MINFKLTNFNLYLIISLNLNLINFNLYLIISLNLNLINFCNSSNKTIFLSFNFINFKLTNFHPSYMIIFLNFLRLSNNSIQSNFHPSYIIIFLNFLQLFNNSNQFSIKFHN